MARFYAEIRGNRGSATRMGTASSGISGHIRGWRVGARVECTADRDHDIVRVYATGGSLPRRSDRLIATLYADGKVEYTPQGEDLS